MSVAVRSLGVESPGVAGFFEWEESDPEEGGFVVETTYSGFSAGTELTYFKGTNPYLHSSWDEDLCTFREGTPAKAYPIPSLGYMEAGRVVSSAGQMPPGTRVAMAYGHRSHYVARSGDFCVPLPPDLDPVLGTYVAQMGPICANGLLHAAADVAGREISGLADGVRDRKVVIAGAGVVGLLVAAFARRHGAEEVVMVDASEWRLEAARALGCDALDEGHDDVPGELKSRWRHGPRDRGADVVFQCRGQAAYLSLALRCLRPQGSVIDLAFYQGGAPEVRLGEEFHHNGLSIRCAQIARVPRGLEGAWNRRRLSEETIALLQAEGPSLRAQLVTDIVPFEDGPEVIADLAERRRRAIGIVFEMPSSV